MHHTAHPHIAADGAIFNLATIPKIDGLHYCVVNFPQVDSGKALKIIVYLIVEPNVYK